MRKRGKIEIWGVSWEWTCLWDAKCRDCWWSSWCDSVSSWWACSPWSLWLRRNRLMIHNSARAWTATTATTPKPNPSKIEPQNDGILIFEAKKVGYKVLVRCTALWCRIEVEKENGVNTEWKRKETLCQKRKQARWYNHNFLLSLFLFLSFFYSISHISRNE